MSKFWTNYSQNKLSQIIFQMETHFRSSNFVLLFFVKNKRTEKVEKK